MSWIGGVVGYMLGARFGALGGIIGAVIGSGVGDYIKGKANEAAAQKQMEEENRRRMRNQSAGRDAASGPRASTSRTSLERELVFLSAVGAMLAKLSKADGHVDETEIAAGEEAFVRLGLTPEKREICIKAFRAAKSDSHSIFDYASSFADVTPALTMRELLYDILWDVACADGVLAPEERRILEMIVTYLRIRPSLYSEQYFNRVGTRSRSDAGRSRASAAKTDPYEVLGCSPRASEDELRRAYRALAKKHHPDLLRAQGLPEEMIERATEKMARINAAWDEIRSARGI